MATEAVRLRLAEIERANGGRLTPAAVVEDAKDEASPLHSFFEWDVEKASHAQWLHQARTLIRSVLVITTTENVSVRTVFYTRDPSAAGNEPGYVSIRRLRADHEAAREAIVAEFTQVAVRLRRARDLAVALGAAEDVDDLLTRVAGVQAAIAEQPSRPQ